MKTCESLMTKNPVCCLPSDSVVAVAQLMERENIGSIPVIENEQNRKLIGIVTDRDLALKVVAQGYDAKSVKVELVMTRKLSHARLMMIYNRRWMQCLKINYAVFQL